MHRTLLRRIRPVLACYWVNWRNGLFCDSLRVQRVLPSRPALCITG
ncbi:hypothetical protein YSA_03070 [Pseudomonas putida ND6]|uniref:Uncharacterized protein n=1 Tax=Pseudomonas putida ND6 TaxID=231023 RepID=I3USG1_PSEPU|nr:hypothetical protein YSA_03070 [Pseudomonas putida ND6]